MKISLFANSKHISEGQLSSLKERILQRGFEIDKENPDVVFYIGGDGTFLRAVHYYQNKLNDLLFVGILTGSLGFFYSYNFDQIDEILDSLDIGSYNVKEIRLLKGELNNKEAFAVNEIRFENPFHTFSCQVFVNDDYLENFFGSGLLVATSYGSTAYSKGLGGAVVSTDLETIQLVEIAPINNKLHASLLSPLVLSQDKSITLKGDFNYSIMGFDNLTSKLEGVKEIKISLSNKTVKIMQPKDYKYIETLKRSFI